MLPVPFSVSPNWYWSVTHVVLAKNLYASNRTWRIMSGHLLFLLNLQMFRILFNRFDVYYHECSITELFLQLLFHRTSDVVSLGESHLSVHTHMNLNRGAVAYLACTQIVWILYTVERE